MVLDGCPRFAKAYLGRKWFFSNAFCSLHEDAGLGERPFARIDKAFEGLRPVFFGPCTLGRTWGTRPAVWASRGVGLIAWSESHTNDASPGLVDPFFPSLSWVENAIMGALANRRER